MRVTTIGAGPYPDFSISAGTVTVGGITVDARERQGDTQEVIDIRASGSQFAEGEGDHLVASIRIPARRYSEQPSGGTDDDGHDVLETVADPLDPHEVHLTLWPYA